MAPGTSSRFWRASRLGDSAGTLRPCCHLWSSGPESTCRLGQGPGLPRSLGPRGVTSMCCLNHDCCPVWATVGAVHATWRSVLAEPSWLKAQNRLGGFRLHAHQCRRHCKARLEAAGHVPDAPARERRNGVPAADAKGGGLGVPPPPLSLQEDGRIRRTSEDVSGVGRSPQSIAFTRVDPEAERHQALGEFRQIAFDSRRLHHFSSVDTGLRALPFPPPPLFLQRRAGRLLHTALQQPDCRVQGGRAQVHVTLRRDSGTPGCAPTSTDVRYLQRTSTRRLSARPLSSVFGAIGRLSPAPTPESRPGAIPRFTRLATTAWARRSESCLL